MKKLLKQYAIYLLVMIMALTSFPIGAFAQTVNVGVNITGIPTIEYVATISADINIDLTEGNKGTTYMRVVNGSNVYLKSKITDIEAITPGAPSTFVAPYDKNWNTLDATETATYIAFKVKGKTSTPDDEAGTATVGGIIYPEGTAEYTGVQLATLTDDWKSLDAGIPACDGMLNNEAVYTLESTVGYAWEETKEMSYALTIVTEIGGENADLVSFPDDEHTAAILDANVWVELNATGIEDFGISLLATSEVVLPTSLPEDLQFPDNVSTIWVRFGGPIVDELEYAVSFSENSEEFTPSNYYHFSNNSVSMGGNGETQSFVADTLYYIPYTITVRVASTGELQPGELPLSYTITGVVTAKYIAE